MNTDNTNPVLNTDNPNLLADPVAQYTAPTSSGDEPEAPKKRLFRPMFPGGSSKKKIYVGFFSVFVLFAGLAASVALVRQSQILRSRAFNCTQYAFSVAQNGQVSVTNTSSTAQASQQADVYIDNVLVSTLSAPILNANETQVIGTVTVPGSSFQWRVAGTSECTNSGVYQASGQITANCGSVRVYDTNWNELTGAAFTAIKPNDVIRLVISGTSSTGSFDSAQFTINGVELSPTTNKRTGTEDYYMDYTVPAGGVSTLRIQAKMHHSIAGWI